MKEIMTLSGLPMSSNASVTIVCGSYSSSVGLMTSTGRSTAARPCLPYIQGEAAAIEATA